MVLEDYGELMFLQTVLKKMGFDVDAIQNPRSFDESLLRMNPDVLVMTSAGKKVRGLELALGVKRKRGLPKIILIRTPSLTKTVDPKIDAWLDSPVGALDLLASIGEVCGLNKEVLTEKFHKLRIHDIGTPDGAEPRVLNMHEEAPQPQMEKAEQPSSNFGVLEQSTMPATERKERYKKFLKEERPEHIGFSVKQVQDQVKTLRKSESTDELAELERQRKAFVEHLFKKK